MFDDIDEWTEAESTTFDNNAPEKPIKTFLLRQKVISETMKIDGCMKRALEVFERAKYF